MQNSAAPSRRFACLPERCALLLLGIAAAALGIALTTCAGLGTTPISTVPYTASAITGLSFGTTTFLLNLCFVLGQMALLRRSFPLWNLLQIPAVFVFGAAIDLAMALVSPHSAVSWLPGLAMSLAGNVVLAVGIVLQIRSRTIVQPGEGIVLALSVTLRRPFGSVKVANDVVLSLAAALLGWAVLGHVVGLREGTLISAVLVGVLVKFIMKRFPERAK